MMVHRFDRVVRSSNLVIFYIDPNCRLYNSDEELGDDIWRAGFDLEDIVDTDLAGKKLIEWRSEYVESMRFLSDTASGKTYINASLDKNVFTLTLNEDFKDYEKDEVRDLRSFLI